MSLVSYSDVGNRISSNGAESIALVPPDSKQAPVVHPPLSPRSSVGSAAAEGLNPLMTGSSHDNDVKTKADRIYRIQQVERLYSENASLQFPMPVLEQITQFMVPNTDIDCLLLHVFGFRKAYEKEIRDIINRLCNGEMRNFLVELAKYDLRKPEEKELVVKILNHLFLPYASLIKPLVKSKNQALNDNLKMLKELVSPDLLQELIKRLPTDLQGDFRELTTPQDMRKLLINSLLDEIGIFSNVNYPNQKQSLSQLALFVQILVFEIHNCPTDKICLPSQLEIPLVALPLSLVLEFLHIPNLNELYCCINQRLSVKELKELLVDVLPIKRACIGSHNFLIEVTQRENCIFVKLSAPFPVEFSNEVCDFLFKNAAQFPNLSFSVECIAKAPFNRTKGIIDPAHAFVMDPTRHAVRKEREDKKTLMQPISPGVYRSSSGGVQIENAEELPVANAQLAAAAPNQANRTRMLQCAVAVTIVVAAFLYRFYYK